MSERRDKNSFKLIVLGKSSVGKTCLIHRFVHGNFCINMSQTLGVAYYSKIVKVGDTEIRLRIWDTAGQERYNAISRMYYLRAKAAILCVDLTDQESFTKMIYWLDELQKNEKECKIYICCTKNDLFSEFHREVTYGEIEDKGNIVNAKIFTTSSKTGQGVKELFHTIADDLVSNPNDDIDSYDKNTIQLEEKKLKFNIKCCRRK